MKNPMTIAKIIEQINTLDITLNTTIEILANLLKIKPNKIQALSHAIALAANQNGKNYLQEKQSKLPLVVLKGITPKQSTDFWGNNLNKPLDTLYETFKNEFVKKYGNFPRISLENLHQILADENNYVFGFNSATEIMTNSLIFFKPHLNHFNYLFNRVKVTIDNQENDLTLNLLKNNYSEIKEQLGDRVNTTLYSFPEIGDTKEKINSIIKSSPTLHAAADSAGMTISVFCSTFNYMMHSEENHSPIEDEKSYQNHRNTYYQVIEVVDRESTDRKSGQKTSRFFAMSNPSEITTPPQPVVWTYTR